MNDEDYMLLALAEAKEAFAEEEVPVGAVLVDEGGELIASGRNRVIERCDPSAHAEILALRTAGLARKNYRLPQTTLYVTIEPCMMCMGALIHARVARVVYGAADPGWGGAGSLYNLAEDQRLNHHPLVCGGVCEQESRKLMIEFFRPRRRR
jgi:tRNA(adenine34) deaminase